MQEQELMRNELEDVLALDGETVLGRIQHLGGDGYLRAYASATRPHGSNVRAWLYLGAYRTREKAVEAIVERHVRTQPETGRHQTSTANLQRRKRA